MDKEEINPPVCSGVKNDAETLPPYPTHIQPWLPFHPNNIVTDDLCNMVFVSNLLKDGNPDYPNVDFRNVYRQLTKALGDNVHVIKGCKDVWVRDFMPVQIKLHKFWNFKYKPDYLCHSKAMQTDWRKTAFHEVCGLQKSQGQQQIVADGGNVVKCDGYVIMTDKVFAEKVNHKNGITRSALERSLETQVVIIPRDPMDAFGHADGMVRYLRPGHVLFRAAQNSEDETFLNDVKEEFHRQKPGVVINQLDFSEVSEPNPLNWCYINFLRVGNRVLLPLLNEKTINNNFVLEDYLALKQLSNYLPNCEIIGINMRDVIEHGGGGLNCLTWTIAYNWYQPYNDQI